MSAKFAEQYDKLLDALEEAGRVFGRHEEARNLLAERLEVADAAMLGSLHRLCDARRDLVMFVAEQMRDGDPTPQRRGKAKP